MNYRNRFRLILAVAVFFIMQQEPEHIWQLSALYGLLFFWMAGVAYDALLAVMRYFSSSAAEDRHLRPKESGDNKGGHYPRPVHPHQSSRIAPKE